MNGLPVQARLRLPLDDRMTPLSVDADIETLLGFSATAFTTGEVKLADLIHVDDADVAAQLFSRAPESQSGSVNLRLRHADGRVRCVRACFSKTQGIREVNPVVELLLQDASSLHRLETQPPRLTTIEPMMDFVGEVLYFKNRDHVFTALNRVARRIFCGNAQDSRDAVGLTDYDLFTEEYADISYRMEKQVLAGADVATEIHASPGDTGSKKWLNSLKYSVRGPEGDVIGLFGVAHDITGHRQTQDKLRKSEEMLRDAQIVAGIGTYRMDIKTGEWTSSDLLDEIFGVTCGYERTLESWAAIVHPDDRVMLLDYFNEVIVQARPFDMEYRIIRLSDGEARWVHGLGRLELDAEGRPIEVLGTIRDITARKEGELALRESKELLRLFIEHAPAAIAMLDRDMRYLSVSSRWLEIHGLAGQVLIGRSHYDVLPKLPQNWRGIHRQAMSGETVNPGEEMLELPDGSVHWIRRLLRPWLTGAGEIGGIILFAEDITKNRETEDRLRLAASMFTHAREGISITDPSGAILEVNETFTKITGYAREEALGKNPRILKSGLQSDEFYAGMWRALKNEGHWSGEVWNRNKSGEIYAEMLNINAVRDSSGNVLQYIALFSDITQLKKHEQQLEHLTYYDVLTSLPNRALLADRVQQAMAQANRRKQFFAVAYLDLDGFKDINDIHGREAGDRLLTSLAFNMKCALREGDTLARLGGDEFVAVILDLDEAASSVPVIVQLLEAASEPVQVGDSSLSVSASIGVTFFPQSEEADPDLLLRQADQAMYQAKLAGGNRYHIFDPEHDQNVRGRHENLEHIRRAMAAREFVLHYQPKVNMRTGKVVGLEALIRWQHPERGLLPPGMFLPVIEDHPLAIELGEWVIETALAQMDIWRDAGLEIPVSVNVGALQLQQPDFVDRLSQLLAAHPTLKPFSLEIEILETSALQDVEQTSQVLTACHGIGVLFALDDFGTGYSSLTYLKRLPASILKIDQSFVCDMLEDPENLSILEGILSLASAFHRQVIAEGVETVEHGLMLLQLGCEVGQGYGIARPMPAEDVHNWVWNWKPDARWSKTPSLHSGNQTLLYACVEHRAWLAAFEAYLTGRRHAPPVMDRHQCRFGKWLESEKRSGRGNAPGCSEIDAAHQRLHTVAAEILQGKTHGRDSVGLTRMSELHAICSQLQTQMEAVGHEA
jgi:diguanylate cyclase (GGDEF)-like protein/PAS domain S-box-containing protein